MLREDVQMSAWMCVSGFDSRALKMKDEVNGMSMSDVL